MGRLKTGQLPTGQIDDDGTPIRMPVTFEVPGRTINAMALELAKPHEGKGEAVALNKAQVEQLRLCLREIDGEPVEYAHLEHGKINKWLTQKQQDTLLKAIGQLTNATEGEVRAFVDELAYEENEDGERFCVGVIEERIDETVADDRPIKFRLPNRDILARAQEKARRFERRGKLVAANEANLYMIRETVVAVDGRSLSADSLRGDKIDEVFSPREQSLLTLALEVLMTAEKGEVDDFLSTCVDPSTGTGGATISTTETNTE